MSITHSESYNRWLRAEVCPYSQEELLQKYRNGEVLYWQWRLDAQRLDEAERELKHAKENALWKGN